MSLDEIASGAAELRAWVDMVSERVPEAAPMLEAKMAEVAADMQAIFQPLFDLAEGKITMEEFEAIQAQREAEQLVQREGNYGEPDEDGTWTVECSEDGCYEELVYEELPPLYPTCEDLTGLSCVEDEEDLVLTGEELMGEHGVRGS